MRAGSDMLGDTCRKACLQVSQRDGRDLDPQHKMWLNYMRKRRAQGAGTYTARKMREEFDRVAEALESAPEGDYDGLNTKYVRLLRKLCLCNPAPSMLHVLAQPRLMHALPVQRLVWQRVGTYRSCKV